MNINKSRASVARWAGVSAGERSKRMSAIAKIRQSKLSPAQKRKHGKKMAQAKIAKRQAYAND